MKRLIIFSAITITFFSCISYNRDKANDLNREGLRLEQQGDEVSARKLFIEASQVDGITDTDKAVYLANLAIAYPEDKDSAKYYYSLAANLNDSASYFYLVNEAHINVLDSNIDAAIYHLNKAYRIKKYALEVNNLLGRIYLGDYGYRYWLPQKAIIYNFQAYNVYRDDNAKFLLAKNYYFVKNYRKSMKLFEEIHRTRPTDAANLYTLIMMKQENGEKDDATGLLNELKQLDSSRYNRYMRMTPIVPGQHGIVWKH